MCRFCETVHYHPNCVLSTWCPWQVGHKVHRDVIPLPLCHVQWLKESCWLLVLNLNLLALEALLNKVFNVSLHSSPIVLAMEITVHLRATWMHCKSGEVKFPKDLLPQICPQGTTTRPLYRRLPYVWMAHPDCT